MCMYRLHVYIYACIISVLLLVYTVLLVLYRFIFLAVCREAVVPNFSGIAVNTERDKWTDERSRKYINFGNVYYIS